MENEKKKTFKDLSVDEQEDMKKMYIEHYPLTHIAEKYDISRQSVSYHANKYWKEERDLMKADLFNHFSDTKKSSFVKISQDAIDVMTRALSHIKNNVEAPTLKDAKAAAEVISALDKIIRLDENKPTDITEDRAFDVIELKKKFNLDPFAAEEAEYREIEQETNEDE